MGAGFAVPSSVRCAGWRRRSGGSRGEAGAARIDVVGGDADEELAEGFLDGVVACGSEEREGAAAGVALARTNDGAAGVVVEVAELLFPHARAAAANSVGEDVVTLIDVLRMVVVGCSFDHGYPLVFVQNLQKREFRSGPRAHVCCQTPHSLGNSAWMRSNSWKQVACPVKHETPACCRGLLSGPTSIVESWVWGIGAFGEVSFGRGSDLFCYGCWIRRRFLRGPGA